jgi:hypothetical protein
VALMEPAEQATVHSPVTFYFHVDDAGGSGPGDAWFYLDGESVASVGTSESLTIDVAPGEHTWQVEGLDRAGNRGLSPIRSFAVRAEPVTQPSSSLAQPALIAGGVQLSFTTVPGLNYVLEKSTSRADWSILLRTNASENIIKVADKSTNSPALFRVRSY